MSTGTWSGSRRWAGRRSWSAPPAGWVALAALSAISALWSLFLWAELLVTRSGGRSVCGFGGRLDCATNQPGLELSCAWMTFLPRPATGRAAFTRASASERRLSGTWGTFLAATGGGAWDAQGL